MRLCRSAYLRCNEIDKIYISSQDQESTDMKSFNIIFALLLVLFGSSNVFAQTCPSLRNVEETRYSDSTQASYFLGPYDNPVQCICLMYFNEGGSRFSLTKFSLSNHGKDNGYPKTQKQIQAIVENKSRCPNENEYKTIIKPIFLEEDEPFKKEYAERMEKYEQRKENERLQQEAAKAAKRIEMAKICKGVPKINQDIIENVSIAGRIDPGSIRLNRVYVSDDGNCMAVFYTSIGIALSHVGFNANGVIVSNQKIVFAN